MRKAVISTRIPTHYNDESEISQETLNNIYQRFYTAFGGCTVEAPGQGMWADMSGKIYDEPSYRLEVAIDHSQYSQARELVIEAGRILKQKAMYFEARYLDGVEILDID